MPQVGEPASLSCAFAVEHLLRFERDADEPRPSSSLHRPHQRRRAVPGLRGDLAVLHLVGGAVRVQRRGLQKRHQKPTLADPLSDSMLLASSGVAMDSERPSRMGFDQRAPPRRAAGGVPQSAAGRSARASDPGRRAAGLGGAARIHAGGRRGLLARAQRGRARWVRGPGRGRRPPGLSSQSPPRSIRPRAADR